MYYQNIKRDREYDSFFYITTFVFLYYNSSSLSEKYNFMLTFRKVNKNNVGEDNEFQAVFYIIDCNENNGVFATNFLKSTSNNTFFCMVNPTIPHSIFKSIVYGEAIRIRILNGKEDFYHKSLNRLEEKCIKSNFNKNMVYKVIQIVRSWKTILGPNKTTGKTSYDCIVWP